MLPAGLSEGTIIPVLCACYRRAPSAPACVFLPCVCMPLLCGATGVLVLLRGLAGHLRPLHSAVPAAAPPASLQSLGVLPA